MNKKYDETIDSYKNLRDDSSEPVYSYIQDKGGLTTTVPFTTTRP